MFAAPGPGEGAASTGREAATAQEAQIPGITRIDLQRQDLSAPGRKVIQNRVEISDGAPLIRHKHPREEIIYVLQGSLGCWQARQLRGSSCSAIRAAPSCFSTTQ